jgi:hypothetical protein
MAKKKDANILHDMASGLKSNKNQNKVREFLTNLKDVVDGKNIQEKLDFEVKEPEIIIDTKDPKSKQIASDELKKIRSLLKP